jgi:hypothetical protein
MHTSRQRADRQLMSFGAKTAQKDAVFDEDQGRHKQGMRAPMVQLSCREWKCRVLVRCCHATLQFANARYDEASAVVAATPATIARTISSSAIQMGVREFMCLSTLRPSAKPRPERNPPFHTIWPTRYAFALSGETHAEVGWAAD